MMTTGDYANLWDTANLELNSRGVKLLDYICRTAVANQNQYRAVQFATGVPWVLIAAIHYRESDQDFRRHLHNGDPLTAKTVHEPAGRPQAGSPPYPWQMSASDALAGSWRPKNWYISTALEFLERYNGLGYQKHGVNSPYLWDWTTHYHGGLFRADGVFSPGTREDRAGCVAILKTLQAREVPYRLPF